MPAGLPLLLAGSLLLPVGAAAGRIPLVRVGLAPEVEAVRLTAEGPWFLGIAASGLRATRIPAGEEWTFRASGGAITIVQGYGGVRGASSDTLFAYPEDSESGPLHLDGRAYRGQILLWAAGNRLTAVNVVDLESYLKAVLPAELGPQPLARLEALKAQAVAARSYTLAMMGRWRERGFDLLATVEDQVYGGIPAERATCSEAAEETRGMVAVFEGAPIRAYYCSTCGGHTAAPDEVWDRPAASYLRGVRDQTGRVNHSFCRASPWFKWEEEWKGGDFESMLRRSLPRVKGEWSAEKYGHLTGISIQKRSASRRVSALRLGFQHGNVELSGDAIRWALRRPGAGEGLRSALLSKVSFSKKRGRIDRVHITGQGYGHGVGMCQFGAMGMSEAGYSYDQIIHFYYRGADLLRCY